MSTAESQITTLDDVSPEVPEAPKKRGRPAQGNDAQTLKGANADPALSGKMAMLTVHPTGEDGGKNALFVGLNGYAYQIPRGQAVKVPIEVAHAANPMMTSYQHMNGQIQAIETPRNPVTIIPL